MKREATGGAVVAVLFTAGILLFRVVEGDAPRSVPGGPAPRTEQPALLAAPRPTSESEEVAALRSALAASQEHASDLEKRLIAAEATHPEKPAAEGPPPEKKLLAKKGQDAKLSPPLDPKEAEERIRALLEKADWSRGARGMAHAWRASTSGRKQAFDEADRQALSDMFEAAVDVARTRGRPLGLVRPLSDPAVRTRFVPAWVDAFAGGIDAGQTAQVRAQVDADNAAHEREPAPVTLVAQVRRDLADKLSLEQELARILRPEQLQAYLEGVTADPYFGEKIGRHEIAVTSAGAGPIAAAIVLEGMRSFSLGDGAREGLNAIARPFADDVVRVPAVDPALPLGERRAQSIRRAIALLDLQAREEAQLADAPGLSDEERTRVRAGSTYVLEFVPER